MQERSAGVTTKEKQSSIFSPQDQNTFNVSIDTSFKEKGYHSHENENIYRRIFPAVRVIDPQYDS